MEFLGKQNEVELQKEIIYKDRGLLETEKEILVTVSGIYHENLMGDIGVRRESLEAMKNIRIAINDLEDKIKHDVSVLHILTKELFDIHNKEMGRGIKV